MTSSLSKGSNGLLDPPAQIHDSTTTDTSRQVDMIAPLSHRSKKDSDRTMTDEEIQTKSSDIFVPYAPHGSHSSFNPSSSLCSVRDTGAIRNLMRPNRGNQLIQMDAHTKHL